MFVISGAPLAQFQLPSIGHEVRGLLVQLFLLSDPQAKLALVSGHDLHSRKLKNSLHCPFLPGPASFWVFEQGKTPTPDLPFHELHGELDMFDSLSHQRHRLVHGHSAVVPFRMVWIYLDQPFKAFSTVPLAPEVISSLEIKGSTLSTPSLCFGVNLRHVETLSHLSAYPLPRVASSI